MAFGLCVADMPSILHLGDVSLTRNVHTFLVYAIGEIVNS